MKTIKKYPYHSKAPDNWTVGGWKEKRFRVNYLDRDVVVCDGQGKVAPDNMTLGELRRSYIFSKS